MLLSLAEKVDITKAMLEGKEYDAGREVVETDTNCNKVLVE